MRSAESLLREADRRPEPAVLDRAIVVLRRLVEHPGAGTSHTLVLASLLFQRSQQKHDSALLHEAKSLAHRVLRAPRTEPPQYRLAQSRFTSVVVELAIQSTDSEVLDLAVECLQVLLDLATEDDDVTTLWHNLAVVGEIQHRRLGRDLADAVEWARRAVVRGTRSAARRLGHLQMLTQLLVLNGQLDEAVAMAREGCVAAAAGGPGSAEVAAMQVTLGWVLQQHFVRSGRVEELDECIALLRQVDRSRLSADMRKMADDTLATALRLRFGTASPDLDTLGEAVELSRRTLAAQPPGHPDRAVMMHNLCVRLRERYGRTGDPADIDEATALARAALEATPLDDPRRPSRIMTLATVLTARHRRTGDRAALEEAVDLEQDAVGLTAPDAPELGSRLTNLSAALVMLASITGHESTWAAAVRAAGDAVEVTPAGHPMLASRTFNHGLLLMRDGDRADLQAALPVLETAAGFPGAVPLIRFRAHRRLGYVAAGLEEWGRAADALGAAVRLLPMLAPRNLRRRDAEHQLTELQGVHLDAAAAALHAKDPQRALVLLEQGRGVLLSYALDARTELTDLRDAHPGLADEFERVVDTLGRADARAQADEAGGNDRRYRLLATWEEVVDRIRATPGFHGFARPPALDELLRAGAHGPVVTIVVSALRCDALVVTHDGLRVVPLPDLHADETAQRAQAHLDAIDRLTDGEDDGEENARSVLDATLVWLWKAVAGPVLDALGFRGTPPAGSAWPRLWWSPTGPLALLPLHAAGQHDRRGRSVLDRVVSSYTPTLRTLLHTRDRDARPAPGRLVVAVTRAPGAVPLPGASTEARNVAPDDSDAVRLVDADATVSAVTEALLRAGRAHFACHAVTDPASPSETHLLLADGALPVREISRLRLPHVELAYLSACSTARGDARLADEAIHVSSAFQLAGYRHVVGTLWPVLDTITGRMTRNFYARLADGDAPAEALHAAVRETRSDHLRAPFVWAAHVHAGP